LIKAFTTNYDAIDGNKAKGVVQRMINLENKTLSLRQDFWAKFMKALGQARRKVLPGG
jgi:hypothetical protein